MTTECKATSNVDLTKVKPYGDTFKRRNDRNVFLLFQYLYSEEAEEEAAKQLVKKSALTSQM